MRAGATAPSSILVMSLAHILYSLQDNFSSYFLCVLLVYHLQETLSAPYFVYRTGSQGCCSYFALLLYFFKLTGSQSSLRGYLSPLCLWFPGASVDKGHLAKTWMPAALLEIRMASALADVGDINHSLRPQTLFWPKPREQWLVISKCLPWKAQADLHMEQNSCFHTRHTKLQPSTERTSGTIKLHVLSTTNSDF